MGSPASASLGIASPHASRSLLLRIRRARVDVNVRDMNVPTKTGRSARDLPVPQREVSNQGDAGSHLREHLSMGRPLAERDLLLSRASGTPLPVRDYRREFAAQHKAAGVKPITLGKVQHSNISRMRAAGTAADVVVAWHSHTERNDSSSLRAGRRRPNNRLSGHIEWVTAGQDIPLTPKSPLSTKFLELASPWAAARSNKAAALLQHQPFGNSSVKHLGHSAVILIHEHSDFPLGSAHGQIQKR